MRRTNALLPVAAVVEALYARAASTVRAVSSGTATITVTADDASGNRVSDTFDVTVPKHGGL